MSELPDPLSYRASDADRERFLDVLREAYAEGRLDRGEYEERMHAALAARTYGDLIPILADLPVVPGRLPQLPLGPQLAVPPARVGGVEHLAETRNVVAVLSSSDKRGEWLVPQTLPAVSVLGEIKLDLTDAILSGPVVELKCSAVLGEVVLLVPDVLRVEVDGVPIMGEFKHTDKRKGAARQRVAAPEAPLIRVTGVAVMGSVEVRTVTPKHGPAKVRMLGQAPPRPELGGPA